MSLDMARARTVVARVNDAEYRLIRDNADAIGCSRSDYIRTRACVPIRVVDAEGSARKTGGASAPLVVYDRGMVVRLTYQIRALGLQYNQALKALNTLAKRDWILPGEGRAVLEGVHRELASIDAAKGAMLDRVDALAAADRAQLRLHDAFEEGRE